MIDKIAIDSNVLIYIHDKLDRSKSDIAISILADRPIVCTQVISEYLNTLKRLLIIPKHELLLKAAGWLDGCPITTVSTGTLNKASVLIKKYDFQIFDSIIVAAALEMNCNILYSEDMQDGLVIEDKLTIVNPFKID